MKRIALALVLALAAFTPAQAEDATCPAPRCIETVVPTNLKVPDAHIRVILPRDYDTSTRAYPVLYLLGGTAETYKSWTDNTDVLGLTSALDLIVVMPDGGHGSDAGWYSDWVDGSRQWESFHTGDLVNYVEATFRTLGAGHRAVAGLSMGGFGAMSYAARHPGEFAVAASFSGAVDNRYAEPVSGVVFTLGNSQFGTPDDRVWGNQVTNEETWREHNPTDRAADLKGTKLLIASGNGLPGGAHEDPTDIAGYVLENGIWQMNMSFVRALDAAGVAHTDLLYGSGQHSWPYWRDDLSWALPQIMEAVA